MSILDQQASLMGHKTHRNCGGTILSGPDHLYCDRCNVVVYRDDLVLCESADGWSLHAPGSTDEQIATGDAPYLVSGEGKPSKHDYDAALTVLYRRGL